VFVGDVELGTLSDKQLTLLRRTRIGFVFQAFNLVPTLTAAWSTAWPTRPPSGCSTRSSGSGADHVADHPQVHRRP
jgi:predicted ABC-type transport system involved in lysophospholipase L1 biosynthesis ATPase subunit